jgi:type III restriction enzyme
MVARVCRELGSGRREIVVFNDDAHHCYRGRLAADQHDGTEEALKGTTRPRPRPATPTLGCGFFTGLE